MSEKIATKCCWNITLGLRVNKLYRELDHVIGGVVDEWERIAVTISRVVSG